MMRGNSYFYVPIFVDSQHLFSLLLVLREVSMLNQLSASSISNLSPEHITHFQGLENILMYALIVVGSLPILVLYPLAQRCFVKGLCPGSLKG